eukprot:4446337-Prymnesium_polylepis.1
MLHVNPKVRDQHPRLLERLCWLAAAEQQVVFDDVRSPTASSVSSSLASWGSDFGGGVCHRMRNATSEWTGDERAH